MDSAKLTERLMRADLFHVAKPLAVQALMATGRSWRADCFDRRDTAGEAVAVGRLGLRITEAHASIHSPIKF